MSENIKPQPGSVTTSPDGQSYIYFGNTWGEATGVVGGDIIPWDSLLPADRPVDDNQIQQNQEDRNTQSPAEFFGTNEYGAGGSKDTDNQIIESDNDNNENSSSNASTNTTTIVDETPNKNEDNEYVTNAKEITENANEQLEIINQLKEKYPGTEGLSPLDMEKEWDPEDLKAYNDAVANLNKSKEKLKEILNIDCKTLQTDKGKSFKDAPTCESFLNSASYRDARAKLTEIIDLPDPCGKGELGKINNALLKFFKRLKKFKKYGQKYLDAATLKLQKLRNLVKSITNIIASALKSLMQKVRNWLLSKIRLAVGAVVDALFPLLARKIKNTVIGEIINQILCKFKDIIGSLGDLVGDFLFELIGKVVNVPFCAAQQFANSLINNVAAMVDSILGPILDGIGGLLGGIGKIVGSVFQAIDFVLGLESFLCQRPNCPEIKSFQPDPWGMGGSLKSFEDNFANFSEPTGSGINKYIDNLSIFGDKLGEVPDDFPSSITRCDVSSFRCGPPKIEIFGGGGVAAAGQAVVDRIGRVIGVNVTNQGAGYDRAPFVTIIDPCENGNYASAYAEIGDPGTSDEGKVVRIVIVNTGNGYLNAPNGLTEFEDPDGIATILPFPVEDTDIRNEDNQVNDYIVCLDGFEIISTGVGYTSEDEILITPDIPNLRASVQMTQLGQIIDIQVAESVCGITDIPVVTINSPTGAGVEIRPILSFTKLQDKDSLDVKLPETVLFAKIGESEETIATLAQRNIVRVIDCVS